MEVMRTIFGNFAPESKRRLDITYDYETCAIRSFRDIAAHIGATQIVDIGANIGVYSIYTSDLPSVTGVHAFEPAPDTLDILRKNIAIQSNSAIHAYDVALSNRAGETRFNIFAPLSGANSIERTGNPADAITVKTARLDDVLNFNDEIVAVKIDVEGHEFSVIEGAHKLFLDNLCFLQVEVLQKSSIPLMNATMDDLGYMPLFSLQHDLFYIHRDRMLGEKPFLDIIAKNLATDLHDLTELRREKRTHARQARLLWEGLRYERDPLVPE